MADSSPEHSIGRTAFAIAATLPIAIGLGILLGHLCGLAIGRYAIVPIWVALAMLGFRR
ncbi:MAG: hypothetical protein QM831_38015 [Kofleriaceae bacterium]